MWPGQQAIAKAIRLIPAIRAMTIPTPAISTPNSKLTTIGGYTSRISPVAASLIAAEARSLFIATTSYHNHEPRRRQFRLHVLHVIVLACRLCYIKLALGIVLSRQLLLAPPTTGA